MFNTVSNSNSKELSIEKNYCLGVGKILFVLIFGKILFSLISDYYKYFFLIISRYISRCSVYRLIIKYFLGKFSAIVTNSAI